MTKSTSSIASTPAPTVSFDDEDMSIEVQTMNSIGNNTTAPSFTSFCWKKGGKYFLPLLVVVGIVAAVLLVLQPTREQVPFADFIFFRDAWEGMQADELPRWNTRGAGVPEN